MDGKVEGEWMGRLKKENGWEVRRRKDVKVKGGRMGRLKENGCEG